MLRDVVMHKASCDLASRSGHPESLGCAGIGDGWEFARLTQRGVELPGDSAPSFLPGETLLTQPHNKVVHTTF